MVVWRNKGKVVPTSLSFYFWWSRCRGTSGCLWELGCNSVLWYFHSILFFVNTEIFLLTQFFAKLDLPSSVGIRTVYDLNLYNLEMAIKWFPWWLTKTQAVINGLYSIIKFLYFAFERLSLTTVIFESTAWHLIYKTSIAYFNWYTHFFIK